MSEERTKLEQAVFALRDEGLSGFQIEELVEGALASHQDRCKLFRRTNEEIVRAAYKRRHRLPPPRLEF